MFKVMSHAASKSINIEEVIDRLRAIATEQGSELIIRDDLTLLHPTEMPLLKHAGWLVIRHFQKLKALLYDINIDETLASLNLVEKEIAVNPSFHIELVPLFEQAVTNLNVHQTLEQPYDPLILRVHHAVFYRDIKTLMLLVRENRACLELTNSAGETPLHAALRYGYDDIAKFLINESTSLIVQEKQQGFTPLHTAIQHERLRSIEYLLNKPALLFSYDLQNRTPLMLAKELGNRKIINAISRVEASYYNLHFNQF